MYGIQIVRETQKACCGTRAVVLYMTGDLGTHSARRNCPSHRSTGSLSPPQACGSRMYCCELTGALPAHVVRAVPPSWPGNAACNYVSGGKPRQMLVNGLRSVSPNPPCELGNHGDRRPTYSHMSHAERRLSSGRLDGLASCPEPVRRGLFRCVLFSGSRQRLRCHFERLRMVIHCA